MKLWKMTNYDDLYLFYNYKKRTNFQVLLIIPVDEFLTYIVYSIFQEISGQKKIIEVLHCCHIGFHFENGDLEAVLEVACLYLIEMFKNSGNIERRSVKQLS